MNVRILNEVIRLLKLELKQLHRKILYPAFSIPSKQIPPLPLPDSINQIDIMEITSGFFYILLEKLPLSIAKPFFTDVAHRFEYVFGIKFDDIHKRREDVLRRKPQKRTEFLQGMIQAIIRESNKKGYL